MGTRKFCFICGKATDTLIEGYCEECYGEKQPLIEVPKDKFELTVCSKCARVKYNNKWQDISVEEVLNKKIKEHGRLTEFEIVKDVKEYHVRAKGYNEGSGKLKEEKIRIPVHINKIICSMCIRKGGGYYEAIIQIRGNYTNDVLDRVAGMVERDVGRDEKAFISKISKVRGGVDFYIGNKNIASKIADELRREFNAELKKSYELVTQKEGKDVYRNIISVRI